MELAAMVVVPGIEDFIPQNSFSPSSGFHSSLLPVLGNDVLRTWTERIHRLGVPRLWLASDGHPDELVAAFGRLASEGIKRLLMIRLKSYAEIDLFDLLQFHCQKRNSVTEAHDSRGQLGVSIFDRAALPTGMKDDGICKASRTSTLYPFHGYVKRILSATERQELVRDALTGGCAMRPLGEEIREQVWVGEGVSLAPSAKVIGPTYIGDRTVVRSAATIGPFASVERDCLVDCGTTVERATVLPDTYLASGILIRHALVDGGYLEDLRCGAVADLLPSGLAGRRRGFKRVNKVLSEPVADDFGFVGNAVPSDLGYREMRL